MLSIQLLLGLERPCWGDADLEDLTLGLLVGYPHQPVHSAALDVDL